MSGLPLYLALITVSPVSAEGLVLGLVAVLALVGAGVIGAP